jgi:hypothetical protein
LSASPPSAVSAPAASDTAAIALLRRRHPGAAQHPPHRLAAQIQAFYFLQLFRQVRIVESGVFALR